MGDKTNVQTDQNAGRAVHVFFPSGAQPPPFKKTFCCTLAALAAWQHSMFLLSTSHLLDHFLRHVARRTDRVTSSPSTMQGTVHHT